MSTVCPRSSEPIRSASRSRRTRCWYFTTATRSQCCPSCRRLLRRRAHRALRRKIRHRKPSRSRALRWYGGCSSRRSQGVTPMFKSLLAATCTLSLVSCVKQDEGQPNIDHALPTADQVSIKLPQSSARTLDALAVGQTAVYYVATRDVTRMFNGGAEWVLVLNHAIVQTPPTSVNGNVYTWGPGSKPLEPADYKLDVTAKADGTFTYQLSGRSKTQANAKFEVVIDGSADPRAGDDK